MTLLPTRDHFTQYIDTDIPLVRHHPSLRSVEATMKDSRDIRERDVLGKRPYHTWHYIEEALLPTR